MLLKNKNLNIIFLLVLTFIAYAFSLSNDFVNWDDYVYVVDNPDVKNFSFDNVKLFFTKSYNKTYVPLTMLSWTIEYAVAGENPFLYILDNIILHMLCVLLVYLISNKLFNKEKLSLIIAALFALHPAHVESVVWITERKDVLYAFFYFIALLYYIKDAKRENDKRKFYFVSVLFFILSLFSKGQAVTFSLVIFAVDIFIKKDWFNYKNILEKIPFILLSIVFGIIAVYYQGYFKGGTVLYHFSYFDRIIIASVAFVNYILVTIFPVFLCPVNPLPNPDLSLPSSYLPAIIAMPLFLVLIYYSWRKNKRLFLGLAIFFVSIIMMLDHTGVGRVLYADRFLYISIFGFALAFTVFYEWLEKRINVKVLNVFVIVLIALYGVKTFYQTKVWKNSEALFGYAVKLKPENPVALCNYATSLTKLKKYDKAMEYYNKSLKAFPKYYEAYTERGSLHYICKRSEKALEDYNTALMFASEDIGSLSNRGWTYILLDNYDLAKNDFEKILGMDPRNIKALSGISLYYTRHKDYLMSKKYIDKILKIDPNSDDAYYNLANNSLEQGEYGLALKHINKAIKLKDDLALYYRLRGEIKGRYLNDLNGSKKDLEKAVSIDENDYIAYNNLGLVLVLMNDLSGAESMFRKSLEIRPQFCDCIGNYAILLKLLGRMPEAEKYYQIAANNNCKNNK